MKVLARSPQVLVANPVFVQRYPLLMVPADLVDLPSIHWGAPQPHYHWHLNDPNGATAQISHVPRLVSDDMAVLKSAVSRGVGIASMPLAVVREEISDGRLLTLIPQWRPDEGVITAVFPSRRGLLPSVRALIDFLANSFERQERQGS
ncbi:transcriptional regulator [compost metagenome]